jgi:acyl carrier protein
LKSFYENETRKRISLPAYSFEKIRYWVDPAWKKTSKVINNLNIIHKEFSMNQKDALSNQMENRSLVLNKTKVLIEEISGIQIPETALNSTFLELGFDSLVLTQIARNISSEMKINISFRQLMEDHSTVNLLTDQIVKLLPQEEKKSSAPSNISPNSNSDPEYLSQQLSSS